jgi:hypothetical protein
VFFAGFIYRRAKCGVVYAVHLSILPDPQSCFSCLSIKEILECPSPGTVFSRANCSAKAAS